MAMPPDAGFSYFTTVKRLWQPSTKMCFYKRGKYGIIETDWRITAPLIVEYSVGKDDFYEVPDY
ncbi:hypothetical protein AALA82_03255 [Oscillospiraceae bacterium 50-16]|nr:hypothetical protein [Lawsonibacter sp.]